MFSSCYQQLQSHGSQEKDNLRFVSQEFCKVLQEPGAIHIPHYQTAWKLYLEGILPAHQGSNSAPGSNNATGQCCKYFCIYYAWMWTTCHLVLSKVIHKCQGNFLYSQVGNKIHAVKMLRAASGHTEYSYSEKSSNHVSYDMQCT